VDAPRTTSPTGDPTLDQLLPPVMRLVWAVRESNQDAVAAAIADATAVAGGRGLNAVVVLLAALVPDDQAPGALLAWLKDPEEYLRLRTAGVGAQAAATLAGTAERA
jgi:hypothetical protein